MYNVHAKIDVYIWQMYLSLVFILQGRGWYVSNYLTFNISKRIYYKIPESMHYGFKNHAGVYSKSGFGITQRTQ